LFDILQNTAVLVLVSGFEKLHKASGFKAVYLKQFSFVEVQEKNEERK